jgi:predicted PurR-regulated permease PerM
MTRISPGVIGAFIGMGICLLWLIFHWGLFLLIFATLIGYLVGKLFESEEVREKLRDLFEAMMMR